MNQVTLIGNLCHDIEMKVTNSGKEVVTNSIAVRRDFKNEKGEYDADFINIVIWGPSAKFVNQYAKKGTRIAVTGRWQHRTYQAQDGTAKYVDECVAEKVEILAQKEKTEAAAQQAPAFESALNVSDNDLPF